MSARDAIQRLGETMRERPLTRPLRGHPLPAGERSSVTVTDLYRPRPYTPGPFDVEDAARIAFGPEPEPVEPRAYGWVEIGLLVSIVAAGVIGLAWGLS